jgi:predicted amino acid-binding ACT domain protein
LQIVFTRPKRDNPQVSVIYMAPIVEPEHVEAAKAAGLAPARDVAMLLVEGDNRPGIGYDLMSCIAVAGINLRGLSVSTFEDRFASYLLFETADDLTTAIQLLATLPD